MSFTSDHAAIGKNVSAVPARSASSDLRPGESRASGCGRESFLRLEHVSKSFGRFNALRDISLDIQEGEFVCFLGPSGCGKSTLLRIIAGLARQDAGRVMSEGRDISALSPGQRRFGIVFQSYALFPNLDVRQNITYGLHNQRMPRSAIDNRLAELLDLVGLAGSERKMPAQLSGGQQQRVALARAIAPSPRLLLLDEPLSALDAKVRVHLREQIRELQTRLGVTTIMVTHDQEEAMGIGDRIVAMNHGNVEQVGTPRDIYFQPRTRFVAGFVGRMSMFPGLLHNDRLEIGNATLPAPPLSVRPWTPTEVTVCIRPEHVRLGDRAEVGETTLTADVMGVEFLGSVLRAKLTVPAFAGATLIVDTAGMAVDRVGGQAGAAVPIVIPSSQLLVFSTGSDARNLAFPGEA